MYVLGYGTYRQISPISHDKVWMFIVCIGVAGALVLIVFDHAYTILEFFSCIGTRWDKTGQALCPKT